MRDRAFAEFCYAKNLNFWAPGHRLISPQHPLIGLGHSHRGMTGSNSRPPMNERMAVTRLPKKISQVLLLSCPEGRRNEYKILLILCNLPNCACSKRQASFNWLQARGNYKETVIDYDRSAYTRLADQSTCDGGRAEHCRNSLLHIKTNIIDPNHAACVK